LILIIQYYCFILVLIFDNILISNALPSVMVFWISFLLLIQHVINKKYIELRKNIYFRWYSSIFIVCFASNAKRFFSVPN
jgi:hypothetical protein